MAHVIVDRFDRTVFFIGNIFYMEDSLFIGGVFLYDYGNSIFLRSQLQ